jgi:hypothetical protein
MFAGRGGQDSQEGEWQLEPERCAFALAAVQADLPVQRLHQLFGNAGAQPTAAKTAGDGRVGLGKAVEDACLSGFRDADAGIDDFEAQTLRLALPDRPDIHIDPAVLGKLDGIADQVDEDLAQMARIAMQVKRRLWRNVRRQHQALALGLRLHHHSRAVDQAVQVEILTCAHDTPGFDARDVEHVVDQFQQGVGRCANDLGEFLLFLVEPRFRQQVGDANDAVQWRAQLMAHVGEKTRLGQAGFIGTLHGRMQLARQRGGVQGHDHHGEQDADAKRQMAVPEGIEGEYRTEADCGEHGGKIQVWHAVSEAVPERDPQVDTDQWRRGFTTHHQQERGGREIHDRTE